SRVCKNSAPPPGTTGGGAATRGGRGGRKGRQAGTRCGKGDGGRASPVRQSDQRDRESLRRSAGLSSPCPGKCRRDTQATRPREDGLLGSHCARISTARRL